MSFRDSFCCSPSSDGAINNRSTGLATWQSVSVIVNHGVKNGLAMDYSSSYIVDLSPLLEGLQPVAPAITPPGSIPCLTLSTLAVLLRAVQTGCNTEPP